MLEPIDFAELAIHEHMDNASTALESPLVLVAIDDESTAAAVSSSLSRAGIRTVAADGADSVTSLFGSAQPDAILLESGGLRACTAIRKQDTGRQTPILVVADRDDVDAARLAYQAGASEIIGNPIALETLPYRIHHALRTARSLCDLTGLVRAIPDLIFIVNEDGEVQDGLSGPDATHTLQIKALATAQHINFYPCENDDTAIACIKRALETGKPQVYEHELQGFDISLETRFIPRDKHTVMALVRDITERKNAEAEIFNLAYYDELTELPNRELFSQSLERTIDRAQKDDQKFAILFVDLDRFKRINDTLGHSIGDQLLKDVANRLAKCIRSTDSVSSVQRSSDDTIRLARLGGDEFVIKLYGIDSENTVTAIADRIIKELSPPFNCGGHQFVVTPSIGIAMYPQDGTSGEQLLMNADSAMYSAKNVGRNNFKFYSETMRTKSLHRLDMESLLRAAIDKEQFSLHFQPKLAAKSCEIVGAEALLRWQHPVRGNIQPDEFIPIAEETGLIIPMGQWVLQSACREVTKWRGTPVGAIPISVNISSHQFRDGRLVDDVMEAVEQAGIQPSLLELEITESAMLQDVERTLTQLKALKNFGVSLSIDDFGTGYSSLSYLKRFPIDTIKIDRSFVKDLHQDGDDAAICAAILAMSQQLGLNVVAEGVETREQLEFLYRHGCNHIQGYLFGKPQSSADFLNLLNCLSGPPGTGQAAG